MIMFIYNITKSSNSSHMLFNLNCRYYFHVFYKKDLDLRLKSRIAEELSSKFQELMTVY